MEDRDDEERCSSRQIGDEISAGSPKEEVGEVRKVLTGMACVGPVGQKAKCAFQVVGDSERGPDAVGSDVGDGFFEI